MEGEINKFSVLAKIFTEFTEDNREKLIKTAQTLLKTQKKDMDMLADTPKPTDKNEGLA